MNVGETMKEIGCDDYFRSGNCSFCGCCFKEGWTKETQEDTEDEVSNEAFDVVIGS